MNKLLINEPPLQVLPSLAQKIGLNEAIILQQLHYWIQRNGKEIEGRKWTYNSYQSWQQQFPFWGINTIKRAFGRLEEKGLIVTGNFNRLKIDRTKWYTIDYNALSKLENKRSDQGTNMGSPSTQNGTMESPNMGSPLPETITETTTENKNPIDGLDTQLPSNVDQTLDEQEKVLSSSPEPAKSRGQGYVDFADQVIDYLNEKAGTRFRHSKASRKYIIARLKEGATLEDCKLVIDHKAGKWLHDPEMSEYLRPSTLFRPSHFEEYLAAAIRWHEQGRPRSEKEQEARNKALAALGRKFLEEDGDLEPYRPTPPKRESLPPMSPEEKSLIHEIFGGM